MAMSSCRHIRVLWAVFLAVMGILCSPNGVNASTGKARAAEMRRQGCCCVTKPKSGCCCETKAPLSLNPPAVASREGLPTVSLTSERIENPRSGSCPCGVGEPATPGSKPNSTSYENERGTGLTLALESSVRPDRSATSSRRSITSRGSPPKSPLYLLNSRLLI